MDKFDIEALIDNAKELRNSVKTYREDARDRAELLLQKLKLQDYIEKKKEDDKIRNTLLTILAIIGIIATVAAISYAVYRFVAPDYLEDYDDYEDLDDDDDVIAED
ncbi:DUF4366 domain-containing protein [Oribacterium sp. C9]|uniref:DUF4366 domain-containing protein n=1 Tax=Oribacterium sp. C9 TaxID=1943579 RepID=UPI001FA85AA8|nr:DUF4366 domain-containing protein [Oribacterium sp. C9]